MIEKIKSWKIVYKCKDNNKRYIVAIQVRDGLIYDYHGIILGFTNNSNAKNISEDNKTSVMAKLVTLRYFLFFSVIVLM